MKKAEKHFRKTPAKSRGVRCIPKASKGHFVGELVYLNGDKPQRLGFGSLGEHNAALCLIYRPDFCDIEEQLAALPFLLPGGKPSKHYFDFRFTNTSGRRICISVKREDEASTYEYQALIAQVKKAAIGNICDDVKTITERNIHPIALHNAKLFHSAKDAHPSLDGAVFQQLESISAPVQIGNFLEKCGIGGSGFRSVARAIRFGHVRLFKHEKITSRSLIVKGAAS